MTQTKTNEHVASDDDISCRRFFFAFEKIGFDVTCVLIDSLAVARKYINISIYIQLKSG